MAMITNIQHFMDGSKAAKKLTKEAKELLTFLAAIIEAATIAYGQPMTVSTAACRKDINGQTCFGNIEIWVDVATNHIGWKCVECGDDGVISHWEGTPWDKRNYTRH